MAALLPVTLSQYPSFEIRMIQHPNGCYSAVLYRSGTAIAKTAENHPVAAEYIHSWGKQFIQELLQKEGAK